MSDLFTYTDAVLSSVAACLTLIIIVYVIVARMKLRKQLISTGRLIPTMQMVYLGGPIADNPHNLLQHSTHVQPYPQYGYQNVQQGPQLPPQPTPPPSYQASTQPPPGFYQPQAYQSPAQPSAPFGYSQPQDYPLSSVRNEKS